MGSYSNYQNEARSSGIPPEVEGLALGLQLLGAGRQSRDRGIMLPGFKSSDIVDNDCTEERAWCAKESVEHRKIKVIFDLKEKYRLALFREDLL